MHEGYKLGFVEPDPLKILKGSAVKDRINLDYTSQEPIKDKVKDLTVEEHEQLLEKVISDIRVQMRHNSDLQKIVEGQTKQIQLLKESRK